MSTALRRCPLCDRVLSEKLCATDQIATLLVEVPNISAASISIGSMLGDRYRIERTLAANTSSAVFEALYVKTGQKIALKVLSLDQSDGRDVALRRFFLEAHLSSGLTHPNTIRVFDFGQDDSGLPYIAMELLTGTTLREELQARKKAGRSFSEREAVEIGVAIARSLTEAHHAGLVHRDIKPENVFLQQVAGDEPIVKVLDFGIAKLVGDGARLTSAAAVVGTPAYMSPEQVLDRPLDARSDLYSLGLVLYELVTGERAFFSADPVDTAYARVRGAMPDVRARAATPLSEAFIAIVSRALMRFPEERFVDAAEMRSALEGCRERSAPIVLAAIPREATVALEPAGPTRLIVVKKSRAWIAMFAAALVAVVAMLWISTMYEEPAIVVAPRAIEAPVPAPAPVVETKEPLEPVEIPPQPKTKRATPEARKKRLEQIFDTRI